jgi:D-glycero-alpha-D-manno-heptose 1-phosphate guanylyltransferase
MIRTAIILAGGLGTRLRTVVKDRPKVMVITAGQPFLHYVLTYLANQWIDRVILSVGYLAEQIIDYVGDGKEWHINVEFSQEKEPLGTGGALSLASQNLAEPFFALNGDTLFLVDLTRFAEFHRTMKACASLALMHSLNVVPHGCVKLDEDQHIVEFTEKPKSSGAAFISGGVYILQPEVFNNFPSGKPFSVERQVFPHLAKQGLLAGFVQQAYFSDIGTPESLAEFERDIREGKLKGLGFNGK